MVRIGGKGMSKCFDCVALNELADENESILKEYNLLKLKYDRYDGICYDLAFLGFAIGVIFTLVLGFVLIR
jgi:hypothetical protein